MEPLNSWALRAVLIAGIGVLAACGGGKPSSATSTASAGAMLTPPALTLTLTPTTTRILRFNWPDMDGETTYRLLEDADGTSGYSLVKQLPADTTQHDLEVFLPGRINARYILQACTGASCVDSAPLSVSGSLAEAVGFLKADAPADEHEFGFSIALSEDEGTLAVGAPGEDSDFAGIAARKPSHAGVAYDSGAVYVFVREGQRWQQQAFVKTSAPRDGDGFGFSVALSANGDSLAVGAPDDDTNGAVYLFRRQSGTWSQWQRMVTSSTGGRFGISLALSSPGQVLVVGDPQEDSVASNSGAAYVFTHDGHTWSEQAMLKAPAPQAGDLFGTSVSVNGPGGAIAVGAPDDDNTVFGGGAAYVFTGGGPTWGPPVRLTPAQPVEEQNTGRVVALSRDGSTLAVSASGDASTAIGINGDPTAGGAPVSGAVHVFALRGLAWEYQAYVKASNPDQDDNFGHGIVLSNNGDTLVVSAPYERSRADGINGAQDDNSSSEVGAAYVFQRRGADWRQQAYVKAFNSGSGDGFGHGLALSSDGLRLFSGAPGESSSGGGWNPIQDNNSIRSGAVYLY